MIIGYEMLENTKGRFTILLRIIISKYQCALLKKKNYKKVSVTQGLIS